MRSIGMFTYSTRPRGSVVHAACLSEALSAAGQDVTLYALAKDGDRFYRSLACRLVLLRAREAPSDPERLVRQRLDEIRAGLEPLRLRHDVYHAQDCLMASALLDTAKRPVVRTVHHVEPFANPFLEACQRRSILEADAVISVSAFTEREVREQFGRATPVIHNAVDRTRFEAGAPGDAALEPAFAISPADVLVLSVGGVEERKNSLRALEAVACAGARHPELRWIIAGGASLWDHGAIRARFEARREALSAGLKQRITCLGPIDEAALTRLYQRADVLLAPSLKEGWGLCVLEALAARTAVITSDREPFTEYLDPSTARLVDPESVPAIAGALSELLASADERARLAARGEAAVQGRSWARSARQHLREYERLLAAACSTIPARRARAAEGA